MTLYEFTPPSFPELAWDQSSPLFRHFGTLPVSHTIFKDSLGVWHTLDEGYEESASSSGPGALVDAVVVYRGGRVYNVTAQEYVDLYAGGFIPNAQIGFYPGAYPGPITFPIDDPPPPIIPPGTGEGLFYPGDDTYPGADLYPEEDV